jgi:ligand-binding sensor domain-containing protein/signal transduction histidine kinase
VKLTHRTFPTDNLNKCYRLFVSNPEFVNLGKPIHFKDRRRQKTLADRPLFTRPEMLRTCTCVLLWIVLTTHAHSQNTPLKTKFTRIEVRQGLSHSNVTAFCQDSKGFLWIGTENGLNKYDGYEFKVYRKKDNDTLSLLVNSINYIFEDSRQTLWVATRTAGLHYYDPELDAFVRVPEFSSGYDISFISEDRNKNLWVTGKRLNYAFVARRRDDGTWEETKLMDTPYQPVAIIQDTGDNYWIGLRMVGLLNWNSKTKTINKIYSHQDDDSTSVASADVFRLTKTKKGDLWVGTQNGLSRYNPDTDNFLNFRPSKDLSKSVPAGVISAIQEDGDNLWIGIENGGLSKLDLKTMTFQNYVYDKNDPYSLSDNSIWSVYKDSEGRIWIGTFSRGICVLDNLKEKFHELDVPLENNIVNAILRDSRHRLWIGTEGGLVKYEGGKSTLYVHNPEVKGSLSSNPVLAIFEDSKDRIWIGTWAGGANLYDEKTDSFVVYNKQPGLPESLSDPHVYAITEDKETGNMIIGTYRGVNVLIDEKAGIFKTYTEPFIDSYNYVRALYEDSEGLLWMGTIGGLSQLDINTGRRTDYDISFKLANGGSTSDRTVNYISQDKKGRLCIGSRNGFHIHAGADRFISFTEREGLPSNDVLGFLQDRDGNFWLSSMRGVSKLDPNAGTVVTFDVNDGLVSDELKHKAVFRDGYNTFFFGGTGVSVLNPDSLKYNPHKPFVYFTDLRIQNESVHAGDRFGILSRPIISSSEITIPPVFNFFTISFSSVSFTSSEKNQYAYKLEGFNKDWTYSGNQRSVSFTNLDPGVYTLKVRASNNDGVWSDEPVSMTIRIQPPWWETFWFRVALVLALAFAILTIFRYRIRQVRHHNQLLEKLVQIRTAQLESHKEEIENQNRLLKDKQDELAAQNEELVQNQEEISAQRDLLSNQNEQLINARGIIEAKNREISAKNENLEGEVEKRTAELVEYNQQLEQFAFISAHNLRSPVARILGLGNLFEMAETMQEKHDILKHILNTTRDLDSVVHDLNKILDIRRDNTGIITEIDLTEEIERVKETLRSEIESTNALIEYDFTRANHITTIKSYLDSILFNLLSNSIKYRHPNRDPHIRITSACGEKELQLTFTDNGLGMDLSLYGTKVFSLYNRFHSHVEGKGLGLYLVKTQLESIGGKIQVTSEPDKGTTFHITISQ